MIKNINKNKLKLKYFLNVYKMLDNFPTEEDILFEMVSDENILNGKEVTINYIKHALSFKMDADKLDSLLENLIKQNYIKCIKNKKVINYKLLKHPWI